MRAIILAAGRGSRMKSLTDTNPKCLIEFGGRPLLESQLDAIREAGIHDIAIVTGYKSELLASRGLVTFHNPLWATTNMVSSLACAEDWLRNGPCLVSYSDIFYDSDAIRSLKNCSNSLAITYDPNWLELWQQRFKDPLVDAETFRLNPDHTLTEIGNKPKTVLEVQGQYMGLLRFTPEAWNEVSRIRACLSHTERDKMHMTGTLQKIIDAGRISVFAIPYKKSWGEIDSIEDLDIYATKLHPVNNLKS